MNEPDLARIERLLSDFAWHADRGDGASLAELFFPDAVLIVGGQRLEGRAEIAEDCRRRVPAPVKMVVQRASEAHRTPPEKPKQAPPAARSRRRVATIL